MSKQQKRTQRKKNEVKKREKNMLARTDLDKITRIARENTAFNGYN